MNWFRFTREEVGDFIGYLFSFFVLFFPFLFLLVITYMYAGALFLLRRMNVFFLLLRGGFVGKEF